MCEILGNQILCVYDECVLAPPIHLGAWSMAMAAFFMMSVCVLGLIRKGRKKVCVCVQEYVNDHPQWVKVISPEGVVHHQPWSRVYNDMMRSAEIRSQGCVCVCV